MSRRSEVLADLKTCLSGAWNALPCGSSALARLPADGSIDQKLVARAMKKVFPLQVSACRKIPAVYVALALAELERAAPKDCDATFLLHYVGNGAVDPTARLHAGAAWLFEACKVDRKPKNRARLVALAADADGVAAACATVARHGRMANMLLAVLAHAGGDAAVDAVVEVFEQAVARRGDELDDFVDWFVPFARGDRMKRLAAEIEAALSARGNESPILALAARAWGAPGLAKVKLDFVLHSRQVYLGLTRKMSAWIVLDSHALPTAKAFLTWHKANFDATRWEDGVQKKDELKIGKPKNLDDLPRWLAAAAKTKKVSWDRATARVQNSTLRGKARAAAVAWLLRDA